MARIHILTREGNEVTTVVHIPIPTGNNAAGLSWQQAALNSGFYGATVLRDGDGTAGTIDAAEKATLASCAVFEVVTTLRPQTAQEPLNAYTDGVFTTVRQEEQDKLKDRLRHFGFTRGVNS